MTKTRDKNWSEKKPIYLNKPLTSICVAEFFCQADTGKAPIWYDQPDQCLALGSIKNEEYTQAHNYQEISTSPANMAY